MKKNKIVSLRFTEAEIALIEKASVLTGKTTTDYLREKCLASDEKTENLKAALERAGVAYLEAEDVEESKALEAEIWHIHGLLGKNFDDPDPQGGNYSIYR